MAETRSLKTKRLCLSSPTDRDVPFISGLISDENVRRFLGGPVGHKDLDASVFAYLRFDAGQPKWLVETKDAGQQIGLICVTHHKDGEDFELSYQFSPKVWGLGYATEACLCVLDFARNALGVPHLIAETQSANTASCRLLHRIGMREQNRLQRFGAEQVIYTNKSNS